MKLRISALLLLTCAMCVPAWGQGRRSDGLRVGAQAPGLDVQAWVNGEETAIEAGRAYIISFWESTNPSTRPAFEHLAELQKRYSDSGLTVVAISGEEEDAAKGFVDGLRGLLNFPVAVDRRGSSTRAWVDAANRQVPVAFLVDKKGKIAFIGNPHPDRDGDQLAEILAKVISGRFDPELTRQAEPMITAARNQRKVRNWRMADMYYQKVIDFDDAVFAQVALEKFKMHLLDMNEKEQAYDYARGELYLDRFDDDAGALVMLAEMIASDPEIPEDKRDLDLALEIAETAQMKMGRNQPEALAMVAGIHFRRGEIDKAVDLQKQAFFIAKPAKKAEYNRVLSAYMKAARSGGG